MNGSGQSVEQTFVGGTRDKPKNVCVGAYKFKVRIFLFYFLISVPIMSIFFCYNDTELIYKMIVVAILIIELCTFIWILSVISRLT